MKPKLKVIKKSPSIPKVYEFKVTLLGTTPPVWRSFLAHDFISLNELHLLIQMKKKTWLKALNLKSFQVKEQKNY